MAQIREFVPQKGNTDNKMEFEEKIKKHRRSRMLKIGTTVLISVLLVTGVYFYWDNMKYTSYTQVSTVPRTSASDST